MNRLRLFFARIFRRHGAAALMTPAELERFNQAIDSAMEADKEANGYTQRNQARALRLQLQQPQDNEGRFI